MQTICMTERAASLVAGAAGKLLAKVWLLENLSGGLTLGLVDPKSAMTGCIDSRSYMHQARVVADYTTGNT